MNYDKLSTFLAVFVISLVVLFCLAIPAILGALVNTWFLLLYFISLPTLAGFVYLTSDEI